MSRSQKFFGGCWGADASPIVWNFKSVPQEQSDCLGFRPIRRNPSRTPRWAGYTESANGQTANKA